MKCRFEVNCFSLETCFFSFLVKVLSRRTINATTLYQYTMGNESEMAKLLKSKDGGKNAMRLANTLLSVMSATSDNELKKEDKIKVRGSLHQVDVPAKKEYIKIK